MGEILNWDELSQVVSRLKERNRRTVFTNGCFDLIHIGHVKYLEDAKNLGDVLIVGINSDASVARLKGPSRPILNIEERAGLLAALKSVDYVVAFEQDTPYELIRVAKPDVLVKGGDYRESEVVGKDFVESLGGKLVIIPLVKDHSSTNIINRVIERHTAEKASRSE